MTGLFSTVWRSRELINFLVISQLRSSLHRTWLGSFLHFLIPLLNVAIYYFLIVIIFGKGGSYEAGTFITVLLGIIHYFMLTNAVTYTMPMIYASESILLQLKVEPIVLIAVGFWKSLRISLFGLFIMFAFFIFLLPKWPLSALLYPFILALWILTLWLLLFPLAVLVIFFRDLERLVPIILAFLMYLSPVIYTTSMVPTRLSGVYELNPLSFIFTSLQWAMLGGPAPSVLSIGVYFSFLLLAATGGLALYNWARPRITKNF